VTGCLSATLQALYQSLTPREQELLSLLASGLLNKQAAAILGITEYTVQVHCGHILRTEILQPPYDRTSAAHAFG
jgi:DNA-binding CsgD family transcriptional regulator